MTPLSKEDVIDYFKDYIQFDDQPPRDVDEIEVLKISEPTPDPKDSSRTRFDISAYIYHWDVNSETIETQDHEFSEEDYTLYFDDEGLLVQIDANF